jgi:hypothetical protein
LKQGYEKQEELSMSLATQQGPFLMLLEIRAVGNSLPFFETDEGIL